MGRLIMGIKPFDADEGFPISRDVDGLDTKKIADRQGFHRHLGKPLNTRTEWSNSKTGKRTEPPDYAKED